MDYAALLVFVCNLKRLVNKILKNNVDELGTEIILFMFLWRFDYVSILDVFIVFCAILC